MLATTILLDGSKAARIGTCLGVYGQVRIVGLDFQSSSLGLSFVNLRAGEPLMP